jgi:hypothetical protein
MRRYRRSSAAMLAAVVFAGVVAVAVAGPQQAARNPLILEAAQAEADFAGATWPGAVPTEVLFNLTNNNGKGKGANNGNICNGPDGYQALPLSRGCSAYVLCCEWKLCDRQLLPIFKRLCCPAGADSQPMVCCLGATPLMLGFCM